MNISHYLCEPIAQHIASSICTPFSSIDFDHLYPKNFEVTAINCLAVLSLFSEVNGKKKTVLQDFNHTLYEGNIKHRDTALTVDSYYKRKHLSFLKEQVYSILENTLSPELFGLEELTIDDNQRSHGVKLRVTWLAIIKTNQAGKEILILDCKENEMMPKGLGPNLPSRMQIIIEPTDIREIIECHFEEFEGKMENIHQWSDPSYGLTESRISKPKEDKTLRANSQALKENYFATLERSINETPLFKKLKDWTSNIPEFKWNDSQLHKHAPYKPTPITILQRISREERLAALRRNRTLIHSLYKSIAQHIANSIYSPLENPNFFSKNCEATSIKWLAVALFTNKTNKEIKNHSLNLRFSYSGNIKDEPSPFLKKQIFNVLKFAAKDIGYQENKEVIAELEMVWRAVIKTNEIGKEILLCEYLEKKADLKVVLPFPSIKLKVSHDQREELWESYRDALQRKKPDLSLLSESLVPHDEIYCIDYK